MPDISQLLQLLPLLKQYMSGQGGGMANPVQGAQVGAAEQAATADAMNQNVAAYGGVQGYQPSDIAAVGPPGGAPPTSGMDSNSAVALYGTAGDALQKLMGRHPQLPGGGGFGFRGGNVHAQRAGLPAGNPTPPQPQSVGSFLLTPEGQALMQRLRAVSMQGG